MKNIIDRIAIIVFMVFVMIVLGMWSVTLMVYTDPITEAMALINTIAFIYVIAYSIKEIKRLESSEEES